MKPGYRVASLLMSVLTVGCQGPKGDPGPTGPAGPAGSNGNNGSNGMNPDGGGGGSGGLSCTPGTGFCDGTKIWYCSKTGKDASYGYDCALSYAAQSTATNPYICTTTNCPAASNGACCVPMKQLCAWSLSGVMTSTGQTTPSVTGESCSGPAAPLPGCPSAFSAGVTLVHTSICPAIFEILSVSIQRATVSVGQSVTMPNTAVTLQHTNIYDNTKSCSAWTGTVTFDADAPTWQVSFNVTCSEAGKSAITLTGSLHGNS